MRIIYHNSKVVIVIRVLIEKEIALGILGMKMGIKDFLLLTVMEN